MLLAQGLADRNDVVDVIVKVEPAARKRKRPGIHPVGDVDVIEGKKRFHRAAQQGRVMARQGRDDQKLLPWPGGSGVKPLFKMEKLAKRPLPGHQLDNRNDLAVDGRRGEIERRLVVTPGQPLENFRRGSQIPAGGGVGQRIARMF
jgi:hypothetical protein